jgi:hypothetical protein
VTFASAAAGQDAEVPSAITVRVFSSRQWSLRLMPTSPLANADRGESIDWSRLKWRSRSGKYQPLTSSGAVVARGQRTGPAGQLVTIDLRLAFGSADSLGSYACTLGIELQSF